MDLWLLLFVMVMATYILTWLVVRSDFPPVLWLRHQVAGGWTGPEGTVAVYRAKWSPQWLADLVSCSWCAAGWIAAAVTAGADQWAGLPAPFLLWLAVWGCAALIAAQKWA